MKTLLVMRHAKSDWSGKARSDHDRALAPRGRKAAPKIATWLAEQGIAPEVVRCSSAARTRETLDLLAPAVRDADVAIDDALYLATADDLLTYVQELPDAAATALLIGHNPGLQHLVLQLAGRSPARRRLEEKFPTAALAVLALPVTGWAQTRPGSADVAAYVTPRELA